MIAPSEHNKNMILTPYELLEVGKGMSRLFWGLVLLLLLFSGTIHLSLLERYQVAPNLLGLAILFNGLWQLYKNDEIDHRWRKHIKYAMMTCLLQAYLNPFYIWWLNTPHSIYLFIHVLLLSLVTISSLYLYNLLCSFIGETIGDELLLFEAKLSSYSVIFLYLCPFLSLTIYTIYMSWTRETPLFIEVNRCIRLTPSWLHAYAILPFLLTLITIWKTKGRLATAMRTKAKNINVSL